MSRTNKKLLKELQESKGFTDIFIDSLQDGFIITDPKGRIILVNSVFCGFTGYDKEELIGLSAPFPFWPTELRNEFTGRFNNILNNQLNGEFEGTYLNKTGSRFSVIAYFSNIRNNQNEVIAYIAFIQNVSESKTVLEYRKKYFDLLINTTLVPQLDNTLNNISDGLVTLDKNGYYTYVNKTAGDLLGRNPKSLIGKKLWEEFPESIDHPFYQVYHKAIETQIKQDFQEYYKPLMKWFQNRIYPHPEGSTIYFTEITERKKVEKLLKESKNDLDNIFNNIGDPVFVKDHESRLVYVNDVFCEFFNLSKNDIIGKTLAENVTPEEKESFLKIDKEVLKTGIQNINEEQLTIKGKETRIISTKKNRFVNAYGDKFLVCVIRDITKLKRAESELKSSKEFVENLMMSLQEGLIIVNLDGQIRMVNDATCNILGYSKEELLGMGLPYPFAKIEDFDTITKTNKKIAKGEVPLFQLEFIRKNGDHFLASFSTGNIKNDSGEVIALFGTLKDVSEEEKVKTTLKENAVKSTQKKDVILELASLVGEDVKTSFKSVTKLSAELLKVARVSVWSFNKDKSEIYCEELYSLKENVYHSGDMINYKENPAYFRALQLNKTILINDAEKDHVTKQFANHYLIPNKIKSLMDVFINSGDGYYGILCFEHTGTTIRNWTADEQEFATSIASVVSSMVESYERKIAEEKIAKTNEQLLEANKELIELRNQLQQENVYLRNELDLVFNYEEMVYGSVEFSNVLNEVEKVAPTNATVLLLGESGTGKELLARAIHNISSRQKKPLIKVNCSAIPRELLESELFGHKKGSFTGAFNDKVGKFELADGGTLFLDEIGELPLDMQPKILRFLQEGEIEVVGGVASKKLDVRVIAATNRNLLEEIKKKQFREDLYFRLHVFPIEVPALRKRKDDIPLLVEHFVNKFSKSYEKNIKYISDEAMSQLKAYNWPGNIRELENLIERALILSTGETLIIPGFETTNQKIKQRINNSKDSSLDTILRNHILQVLEECQWKISGPKSASELLKLKPSTLRDKMSKLDIVKPL